MKTKTWYCLGIMSGTSLDGVDIAYIKFVETNTIEYHILVADTIPYSAFWKQELTNAFTSTAVAITKLDVDYGKYLGELINVFIKNNNISNLDFIASHGHTIFHKPAAGYTLQIGNGASIASTCRQQVVCDFRKQDVAKGGEGAPLVPIGDQLLFSDYDYCLNIGGFANISYEEGKIRKAFDICPANIILNHYTRKMGLEYDDQGKIAKKGALDTKLLESLDSLSIYQEKKAMSNEFVVSDIIPLIDSYNLSTPIILNTVTEHIAIKIGGLFKEKTTVLVTGGGAFNTYMIERIIQNSNAKIIIPNNTLINYKEALIFGLLGLLRIENRINVLASVTHANEDHSSGIVFEK